MTQRVYDTSGDALQAGMSWERPWDERLGVNRGQGGGAVLRVRWGRSLELR